MKPFDVKIEANAVEVYSMECHQNPKRPDQNLWRIGVSNGETQAFVYVPVLRGTQATKNFKANVHPGAIISFTGTVDRETIIVRSLTLVRKAVQKTFDFMDDPEEIAS